MSAIGDLFLNPGGGGTPPSESSGSERSLPGTIYFAWKPELDASNHAFSVANQQRAKHGLIAKASPDVFHATICPVGYSHLILDERIQAALKAAEAVMAKPFEVVFDRVRTYQNGQEKAPFVAYSADGLPKAELFRAALVAELRRAGFTFKKKAARSAYDTALRSHCRRPARDRSDPVDGARFRAHPERLRPRPAYRARALAIAWLIQNRTQR